MPDDLRPFSVRAALLRGVEPRMLRRSTLSTPHRGVRSRRSAAGVVERCESLLPVLSEQHFFSHTTAAGIWRLPLPARFEGSDAALHVAATTGREPRRVGVIGHRLAGAPFRRCGALPVASPVDCFVQCSTLLTLDELIVLGDALCGRWSPLPPARDLAPALLHRAVEAASGRGVVRLREAACFVRAGVRSPAETRLRLLLVRHGLPEPVVGAAVEDGTGTVLGHVDLGYPDRRLALEYEGDVHRTSAPTFRDDIFRRELFADAGWRVIRITADDVRPSRRALLVARIRRHLLGDAASSVRF